MNKHNYFKRKGTSIATAITVSSVAMFGLTVPAYADSHADPATVEKLENLQKQIDGLEEQLEAAADAMDNAAQGPGMSTGGWWNRTSVGGYGELHYNGGKKDQLDFHRFVLFINHEFSDRIRLYTEFELEHSLAGEGKPGEVELEQAWMEYDLGSNTQARAGLYIIPVGLLNETHEPPTFYGTERNPVEKNIIPTTWWEGGAGIVHRMDNGLTVEGHIHGGLDVPNSSYKIRSGRQKVANATLRKPAFTGRIKYTGIPGVELATSLQYQSDITQADPGDTKSSATLWEAHAVIDRAINENVRVGFKALYARWDISGSAAKAIGANKQDGFYIEPSVRFATAAGDVGFFYRYHKYDNKGGDAVASAYKGSALGVNYWVHPNAVLKLDYEWQDPPPGKSKDNKIHIGFGYMF